MFKTQALPKKRKFADFSTNSFRFLMLLPTFIILFVFMFYPIFETFRISTTSTIGFGEEKYIGLDNYLKIFSDTDFLKAMLHALQWAVFSVFLQIPVSFTLAFICTTYKGRYVKLLRGIYYIGNILPAVVVAMIARFIFMPVSGLFATLSKSLHWPFLGEINFIGDPGLAFYSLFALATWAYIGFQIAYFMANIEQLPVEHYEASLIDGANKWQFARFIVLPQVWPAIRIQILLVVLGCIKLFDLIWIVTGGGPVNATITMVIYLYKWGFNNAQYGKGAAVGVVIFIMCLIVTILQFTTQRSEKK